MSSNQHLEDDPQKDANQNNKMSNDPADGSRTSFTLGKDGATPAEKKPPSDAHDQSMIETFGEEGAGVAPKE